MINVVAILYFYIFFKWVSYSFLCFSFSYWFAWMSVGEVVMLNYMCFAKIAFFHFLYISLFIAFALVSRRNKV